MDSRSGRLRWQENNPDRHSVTDEYGRQPLIATENDRLHKNVIREIIYGVTRLCTSLGECLVDGRGRESGQAASNRTVAYDCPESVSPHTIRKGVATRLFGNGVDDAKLVTRMDCSEDILWE